MRIVYRFTSSGRTTETTIISKVPTKVLIRNVFLWRDVIKFSGFDGATAWHSSNFGDAMPVDGEMREALVGEAAHYNLAQLFPGRAVVTLSRLGDSIVDGKPYYVIRELPQGGAPTTVLIDEATFEDGGIRLSASRVWLCTHQKVFSGATLCDHFNVLVNGRVVSTVDLVTFDTDVAVDDIQFSPPGMPADTSVSWLLDRYAKALGPRTSPYAMKGNAVLTDLSGGRLSASWNLTVAPRDRFVYTMTRSDGGTYVAGYNGRVGFSRGFNGELLQGTAYHRISGLVYNRCELSPEICDVTVTRLPNLRLRGVTYFNIGVKAWRDPVISYEMLLDPQTFLPYAYKILDDVLYVSDYLPLPNGTLYASHWQYDTEGLDMAVQVQSVTMPSTLDDKTFDAPPRKP